MNEMYDETGGLRPAPKQESFNNIVYSTQNIIGKITKKELTNDDLDLYIQHVTLNSDVKGLYKPKNSHDNLFYKIIGSRVLSLGYEKNMSLLGALKSVLLRPYDWFMFGYLLGNPVIKAVCKPLLFIPCAVMILSVLKKEKVRPKLWERLPYFLHKKKLVKLEKKATRVIKTWRLPDGKEIQTFHMQNDGKHLTLFKLYAFRRDNFMFDITAKICHNLYKKRYGEEYAYHIMKNYFEYQQHPNIELFKNVKDLLND